MAELLVGPMKTQEGGLGYDKVAALPPSTPKDPLGLVPKK